MLLFAEWYFTISYNYMVFLVVVIRCECSHGDGDVQSPYYLLGPSATQHRIVNYGNEEIIMAPINTTFLPFILSSVIHKFWKKIVSNKKSIPWSRPETSFTSYQFLINILQMLRDLRPGSKAIPRHVHPPSALSHST